MSVLQPYCEILIYQYLPYPTILTWDYHRFIHCLAMRVLFVVVVSDDQIPSTESSFLHSLILLTEMLTKYWAWVSPIVDTFF